MLYKPKLYNMACLALKHINALISENMLGELSDDSFLTVYLECVQMIRCD